MTGWMKHKTQGYDLMFLLPCIMNWPYKTTNVMHWILLIRQILLLPSTWYSKHVEESNNIWRINSIQCITLVVLYGQGYEYRPMLLQPKQPGSSFLAVWSGERNLWPAVRIQPIYATKNWRRYGNGQKEWHLPSVVACLCHRTSRVKPLGTWLHSRFT